MVQSPSWAADSHEMAFYEPWSLMTLSLYWAGWNQFKIHFNIILQSTTTSPRRIFLASFPVNTLVHLSYPPEWYVPLPSRPPRCLSGNVNHKTHRSAVFASLLLLPPSIVVSNLFLDIFYSGLLMWEDKTFVDDKISPMDYEAVTLNAEFYCSRINSMPAE